MFLIIHILITATSQQIQKFKRHESSISTTRILQSPKLHQISKKKPSESRLGTPWTVMEALMARRTLKTWMTTKCGEPRMMARVGSWGAEHGDHRWLYTWITRFPNGVQWAPPNLQIIPHEGSKSIDTWSIETWHSSLSWILVIST